MRYLIALIFTLFAIPAQADASRGLCMPYVECKPLAVKSVKGEKGIHVFWFIRSERGTIWHQGFSCPLALCDLTTFTARAQEMMTGKLTPAAARAQVQGFACDYSSFDPIAGENPLCAERKYALVEKIDEWLVGIPEQISIWRVKTSGLFSTRPTYNLVNGVRGLVVVSRVAVGTPCDIGKPTLASRADLWAEFGTPGVVALCAKVAP